MAFQPAFRRAFSPAFRPPFGASGTDLRAQVIAALYSGGRRGFLLDFSDKSTLFQDDAESSPITAASQQIAVARDISGNGLHFRQTSSSARPLYTEVGGIGCGLGDGVNDSLFSASVRELLTNADGMMAFIVTRLRSGLEHRMMGQYSDSATGQRSWVDNAYAPGVLARNQTMFTVQIPGSITADRLAGAPATAGEWYTSIGSWGGAGKVCRLSKDGAAFVSAPAATPATPEITSPVQIFGNDGFGEYSNADIAVVGAVDIDRTSNANAMALLHEFLNARTPA